MAKKILSSLDFNGASYITNLPDPVNPQDAVTKAYTDRAIEGLAWKDSARVATQSNLNLSSPGATIDGVTMAANDRVLVMNQTTQSQNGIYVWNGAAVAMTRSFDAQTANDLEQAVLTVEEGTSAAATYRQTQINFTIGSGNVLFTAFGTAAGSASTSTAGIVRLGTTTETNAGTDATIAVTPAGLAATTLFPKKYTTTIGDGSATSYTVTHNLGTKVVVTELYYTGSTFDKVEADVLHTTTNTITVVFSSAPASGAITVVVIG